jgi:LytS/YehU family sensor histidine kinase
MNSKAGCSILILLLFPLFFNGQPACDCEAAQQQRNNFGPHYNAGNFDSAAYYLQFVKDGKNNICDAFFYNWSTQMEIGKKDYDKARHFLNEEYKILKKINCPNRLTSHYINWTLFYNFLNKYDSAVYVSLKGLAIAEQANDLVSQIRICANLGGLFDQLNQKEKSFEYNKKGVSIARRSGDTASLSTALGQLSNSYLSMAVLKKNELYNDSAFTTAKEGLQYGRQTQSIFSILEAYTVISDYYQTKKDLKSCMAYADSILNLAPRQGNYFNRYFQIAYSQKSNALFELKEYAQAGTMADSSLLYAEIYNNQLSIQPLELIYKTSKKLKDNARALWAHERMKELNDSLFTIEKNAAIAELDKKYNQEKNERKIENLNQQKVFYILLALAGLLLAAAIAFYLRQQSLKHKQKILETEQRLNRARMNPHFFFNALTSLQKVALQQPEGMELASNLSKFSHIMRETLESTYKEYVTIEQEMQFLDEYLGIQKIRFPKKFEYTVSAEKTLETNELLMPSMIIQPFAENSIEHGFAGIDYAGEIKIHFAKEKDEIAISIIDNGKGLLTSIKENLSAGQAGNEHISRASQIIKDRIYLLNIKLKTKARFTIDNNKNGRGVVVEIRLPLIHNEQTNI